MSSYTIKRCLDRAEACRGDGDMPRIIREHDEAAHATDPEVARIARGFAIIARRRLEEERWRAEAYARLARGEDITKEVTHGAPVERPELGERKEAGRAAHRT